MGATTTKSNVWVTLANLTGQDSICLSIASPGNPFFNMPCWCPFGCMAHTLALTSVVPPNNGTVTDMWDLWTVQLPLAQLEPQETELLGSIRMDFCLFFNSTGRNQTHAGSINTSNILYCNASAWCNYTTSNISKSINQPLALPHGVFIICRDHAWLAIPSHVKGGPCSLGRLTLLTPNQIIIGH